MKDRQIVGMPKALASEEFLHEIVSADVSRDLKDNESVWDIIGLQLVSLLMHERPVVYDNRLLLEEKRTGQTAERRELTHWHGRESRQGLRWLIAAPAADSVANALDRISFFRAVAVVQSLAVLLNPLGPCPFQTGHLQILRRYPRMARSYLYVVLEKRLKPSAVLFLTNVVHRQRMPDTPTMRRRSKHASYSPP